MKTMIFEEKLQFDATRLVIGNRVDPKVRVGCKVCGPNMSLLSEYIDAEFSDEITPEDVHANGIVPAGHSQLYVYEHVGLPIKGACPVDLASGLGNLMTYFPDDVHDRFIKWMQKSLSKFDLAGPNFAVHALYSAFHDDCY